MCALLARARTMGILHTYAHTCTQFYNYQHINTLQKAHTPKKVHTFCTHLHTNCTQRSEMHTKTPFCTQIYPFAHKF